MKYVGVNREFPSGGFILVPDKPTGHQIKEAAIRQRVVRVPGPLEAHPFQFQLLGHNANGSSLVIGDNDPPWHHDFTMIETSDNA